VWNDRATRHPKDGPIMTDGNAAPAPLLPCLACGSLTIRERGFYQICPVCGWEDDSSDYSDPERYVGGPNHVTLAEARANYAEFGAAERRNLPRVRPPRPEERPQG
jgi:hypothetical protein